MATALPHCYHGAIGRQECERLLGQRLQDGTFLIRDSETIVGALCLCVYKQGVIYTYRIMRTHTGHYTLMVASGVAQTFFKTLQDLVQHYKGPDQGLATHLRHSVPRRTAMLVRHHSA
ncbi:SH2 domain-containing protein 1B, partial [Synchiropus splendidus]|uniref:SH2 domain-containing protein 1B n=1 Tax=Synchiropus splendidus TaxID=270530 RepID=UPI00237D5DB7